MTNRILAIAKKEIIHIRRDTRTLMLAIGLPVILLLIFGYAITFDIKHIPIAVCDLDMSQKSRELVSMFAYSGYFDVVDYIPSVNKADALLNSGKCKVVLVIPLNFSKMLYRGEKASVQILIDGVEANTTSVALGYIQGIMQMYSSKILLDVLNKAGFSNQIKGMPPVDAKIRVWYNPELRSQNYVIPGLIAVIMMIITAMLTSLTIVREKERGTIEQLIITPVKPYEIMLGKILPYLLIGLFDMLIVFIVGILVFKVPFIGNFIYLFIFAVIFAVCGLGIGLLISTIADSQTFAIQLTLITSMLPAFLLSGFMIPIKNMPGIIQFVTYAIPARYFIIVLRGIFLKGSNIFILWKEFVFLSALAFLLMAVCSKRFKKKLD
ncbi:MAG: ABC transporter permease [Elusimicrobia bacterium]|nr:ABC transporter permease [Elusimicrobiota bacterium]